MFKSRAQPAPAPSPLSHRGCAGRQRVVRTVYTEHVGEARSLARWKFEGESEHLPAAAHRLLVEIALRLGVGLHPCTWSQVFDTDDGVIAGNFLTALGCHAACDQGFAVDEPEAALHAPVGDLAADGAGARVAAALRQEPALERLSAAADAARRRRCRPRGRRRAAAVVEADAR